jgi:hypothetical protein
MGPRSSGTNAAIMGDRAQLMFNADQINALLRLVDAEIEAEISRICTLPVMPKRYEALLTPHDLEFAKQIGICLSC